jgi:hypothetical protein
VTAKKVAFRQNEVPAADRENNRAGCLPID